MFCRSLFVLLSFFLAVVLSVLLRLMDSDYHLVSSNSCYINVCVCVIKLTHMLHYKCVCVCVIKLTHMLHYKCVCVCVIKLTNMLHYKCVCVCN
jgi:hypothetical protein